MVNRIDHAAEAHRIITGPASRYPEAADSVVEVQIAQVHATLALVEQQRIANRIAIGVAIRDDLILRNSEDDLNDWLHEGQGVRGYFSPDEQEALGLS